MSEHVRSYNSSTWKAAHHPDTQNVSPPPMSAAARKTKVECWVSGNNTRANKAESLSKK